MNEQLDPRGVYFYGGPFSNFADSVIDLPHPFAGPSDLLMFRYLTVEHRFQAMKARTPAAHDEIALAHDPGAAKALGRACDLRPDWEAVKYEVMLEALRAKFKIPRFRKALLDTLDRPIFEDSPTDFEWGFRNGGKNLLGKALEQVRAEIRAQRYTWEEGNVTFSKGP